jgi:hypothetical protein
MNKSIIYIGMLVTSAFLVGNAAAQEQGVDRDPFFSDGPRSSGKAASQPRNDSMGRDPFSRPFDDNAPARRTVTRDTGKKLTGIIFSETRRMAIIDGEVVREGGVVGDQKLVAVKSRSIVLTSRTGGKEELFLENFSIGK